MLKILWLCFSSWTVYNDFERGLLVIAKFLVIIVSDH